jgi:putative ABC transport system permease protein
MLPPRIRRALRLPLGRRRVEIETDEEIRFHLAARTDALVAAGLTRAAAEAEALRRFGVLDEVRPQLLAAAKHREEKLTMVERLNALRDDLRYAVRQLRRAPGFSAALALTFALGIGANATMFEILDRLLFRPPAFMADADRVGRVYLRRPRPDGTERIDNNISYLRYTELRDHTRAFAQTAAVFQDDQRVVGLGDAAETVAVGLVSASFWQMFDARPVVGRFFTPDEDRPPRGTSVVVLGYGYWQSRFGGDRAAIGRQLRVEAKMYTIIGVAPKGFHGIWPTTTAAYVPITVGAFDMLGNDRYHLEHNMSWLEMIARLRPGATPDMANAELTRAYRQSRLDAAAKSGSAPITRQSLALTRGELAPLPMDRGPKRSESAKVATWLAGVAVVVLLIACANVANLLIARGIRRRREIAVRVALGVGRGRLVAQLLTESVVVAVLGGVLGLALAHWGGGAIRRVLLPNVDWSFVPLFDSRVLLFTTVVVLFTGLLTGLAPAVHALRADVNASLKAGEREGGGQRTRVRSGLLVAQAALSVVLLIGAALFVRSLHNVQKLDLGWDPDRLLHVRLELRGTGIRDEQEKAIVQRALDRVRAMPAVSSASTLVSVPFWMTWSEDVFVPGMDSSDHQRTYVMNPVGDDYFQTMGTRLLRGRAVSSSDLPDGPTVAVISQAMGKLLWKGKDPIGQCFRVEADTAPCREVVGIAEDMKFGDLGDDESMQMYVPATQSRRTGAIVVRTSGDPRAIAEPLRREMQRLLPGLGYASVKPLTSVLDPVVRQWRLGATMFTIFGALALLLAAVGLYGVIAYDVAQRMREMGVRVALGAQAADIRRLVLWQGIRVATVGVTLGVMVAFVTVRYLEKLLFDTPARDPLAFGAAVGTILLVAVLATLIPARRATRVDPVVALRTE